ncbi:MAG TPA: methyl-accepting chemotaxis protein, partial [Spirochaetota bacterium]|nr:methyl-accepting chemotaxis protein [Spirochaetota bacterium]
MKLNSIQIKMMSIIVVALFIIITISLFVSLTSQGKQLLISTENNLKINTMAIKTIIRESMITGEREFTVNTIKNLKKIDDIKDIAIYKANGNVTFVSEEEKSKYKSLIKDDNFNKVLNENKPLTIQNLKQKEIEYFFPIQNDESCWDCHTKDNKIGAIVYFKISIQHIYKQIENARNTLLVFFIGLGLIFAVIIVLRINKIILKPIFIIGNAFKQVGEGNLETKVAVASNDEIGDFSSYFNIFTTNIKQIITKIKGISENTKRVGEHLNNISSETSASTEEISAIILSSKENIEMLDSKIKDTAESIKKITNSIQKITESIDRQSSAVDQSSSSIEEMAASIGNIAKLVEEKKSLSDVLSKTAKDGMNKVEESIESIDKITKSTNNMLEMIAVINNIAEQTDLLAMNAAIEAAHAGDAGKGFAVVADEIRKLAEITSENAKSIGQALQKAVDDIHTATDINRTSSDSFNNLVLGIQDILNFMSEITNSMKELSFGSKEIVGAITSLLEMTDNIKTSVNMINDNSKQITQNVDQVSEFSYQSSVGMEEVSKGAIQISRSMLTLMEVSK